jgi:hypothetical protein
MIDPFASHLTFSEGNGEIPAIRTHEEISQDLALYRREELCKLRNISAGPLLLFLYWSDRLSCVQDVN